MAEFGRIPPQPPKMKIVRESKSESGRIPPQKMKIIRDSKSKSGRIPPQKNENYQRLQIQEWQNTPPTPKNENCQRVQIQEY